MSADSAICSLLYAQADTLDLLFKIVRYSAPLFAKSNRPRVRAAGPTIAGLAFVPALVCHSAIADSMTLLLI